MNKFKSFTKYFFIYIILFEGVFLIRALFKYNIRDYYGDAVLATVMALFCAGGTLIRAFINHARIGFKATRRANAIGIVSGISYVSYTLIEQPSIRLSYWLINKLKLSPTKHKSN